MTTKEATATRALPTGITPIEELLRIGLSTQEIADNYYLGAMLDCIGGPMLEIWSPEGEPYEREEGPGLFYNATANEDGDVMIGEWFILLAKGRSQCSGFRTEAGYASNSWFIMARPKTPSANVVSLEGLLEEGLSLQHIVDNYYVGLAPGEGYATAEIVKAPGMNYKSVEGAGPDGWHFYDATLSDGVVMVGDWNVCDLEDTPFPFIITTSGVSNEDWFVALYPKAA